MTISIINATELRNSLSKAIDQAAKQDGPTLITRRNSADTALINVDLLEDLLELHDREYVKSIAKARREIASGKTYSLDEVFG